MQVWEIVSTRAYAFGVLDPRRGNPLNHQAHSQCARRVIMGLSLPSDWVAISVSDVGLDFHFNQM